MSTAAERSGPDSTTRSARRPLIDAGTAVEVRNRFDRRWSAGFEIADRIDADLGPVCYRLRRTSDGAILPVPFIADDIIVSPGPPTGTQ